jgi:hypothetical protein
MAHEALSQVADGRYHSSGGAPGCQVFSTPPPWEYLLQPVRSADLPSGSLIESETFVKRPE